MEWAPDRPVYRHVTRDRYIFWNAGGLGWSIGKRAYLATGSHWHRSKFFKCMVLCVMMPMAMFLTGGLDNSEPWQGRWERGVVVECHGNPDQNEGQPD